MDIFNILQLIGGLALFLFGMNIMGESLKSLSGSKLEKVLARLTSNRFKGLIFGMLVTAVIQSSSATTVMVVGFVNSGIMKLRQAIGIIMGANIGTTLTAWLVSLTGIEGESLWLQMLKPSSFTPILAMIGVIMLFSAKSDGKKDIGTIFLGFTVLMYGMDFMSGACKPLAEVPEFAEMLLWFSNPLFGILAGAILTAIIQSSSASVGILQALSASGVLTYSAAIPIIMGQNIGTCGTALISSVNTNKNARRAALVHLYINVFGTAIFLALFYVVQAFVEFSFMSEHATTAGIAVVHTIFNVATAMILYPFMGLMEKLAYWTVKPSPDETGETKPDDVGMIDERVLTMPSFAIEQCRTMAGKMAEQAQDNLLCSISLLGKYSKKKAELLKENEEKVDTYQDRLSTYLTQLAGKGISQRDSQSVTLLLHCIGDFERISDHALNIMEAGHEMKKKELTFSEKAKRELKVMILAVTEIMEMSVEAFINDDIDKAKEVEPLEEVIDRLQKELRKRHVKRLNKGKYSIEIGFVLSDLLNNLERVADHCSNIAVGMIQTSENNFDVHEYLNDLHSGKDSFFTQRLTVYENKYTLP